MIIQCVLPDLKVFSAEDEVSDAGFPMTRRSNNQDDRVRHQDLLLFLLVHLLVHLLRHLLLHLLVLLLV